MSKHPYNGWINIDKPLDMTSTQAVGKVKKLLGMKKVGHAGTLDPLATGILPIAVGEATKTVQYLQNRDKGYDFTITWGEARSTDDSEGEIIASSDTRPSQQQIIDALPAFTGDIEQIPPKFSAIKIQGERAYDLARDGEEVELKSRKVDLFEARIDPASTENEAVIHVTCGKGFYIRALVRDLAAELGAEGHVSVLKRTRVGAFEIGDAITQAALEAEEAVEVRRETLVPIETALDDVPAIEIMSSHITKLSNGNSVPLLPHELSAFKTRRAELQGDDSDDRLALALADGAALALGEVRAGQFHPARVFRY